MCRSTADHWMSSASFYAGQEEASGQHSVSRGIQPTVCKKHLHLQL